MSVGIKPSLNRFAFLTVQDSDSDSGSKDKVSKDKKKTKSAPVNNNNAKKKQRKNKKKANVSSAQQEGREEWLKNDEHLVEKLYRDDITRALELSKQEYEKERENATKQKSLQKGTLPSNSAGVTKKQSSESLSNKSDRKEKKHKEKASKTISLEQFHQQVEKSLSIEPEPTKREKKQLNSKAHKTSSAAGAGDFFSDLDKDVNQILKKEDQKRDRQASTSSVTTPLGMESHLQNERLNEELTEKDETIQTLRDEVESWEDKYNHVKKRNKQLLIMLQQGEMKEKAELLLEVERLSIIRDQLTTEVSDLHQNLEKERSKVSKLKDDLLKASGKQGKKHAEG